VLDKNTHRIQRLTPLFEKFSDADFISGELFENANQRVEQLAEYETSDSHIFTVQVTDLDQNLHMNNARYGDIILNASGTEKLQNNRLLRIDANFMSQLFIGDEYKVYKFQNSSGTLIEVRKDSNGTPVFRAKVVWGI
jgi:acyl-ACP thioesterase